MDNAYASLPELKIPEDEAKQKIQSQIEKGQEIRDLNIKSEDDLSKAHRERSKWSKFNTTLLTHIFSDGSVAERYNYFGVRSYPMYPTSLEWRVKDFRKNMADDIAKLEGIVEEVKEGLYSISAETEGSLETGYASIEESKVFIVHGTDPTNARDQLKNLLTEWGIGSIILDKQSSRGQTIIEKFERHSEVECAIVLLTPDDEGRAKDSSDLVPRARQNVWFELGFFFGKLGRARTICLHKGETELPSDINGIVYIPFNKDLERDVYRDLRKELTDIGFSIND